LLQRRTEGGFKPIGFWNRKLEKAELNYSTTEREALAIAWSANLLGPHILGHPFVVESDHAACQALFRQVSPNKRHEMASWAFRLCLLPLGTDLAKIIPLQTSYHDWKRTASTLITWINTSPRFMLASVLYFSLQIIL
jgi:hypothetical protein